MRIGLRKVVMVGLQASKMYLLSGYLQGAVQVVYGLASVDIAALHICLYKEQVRPAWCAHCFLYPLYWSSFNKATGKELPLIYDVPP
jgi:hypothetical protein